MRLEIGAFIGFSTIPIRGIDNSDVNTKGLLAHIKFTPALRLWIAGQRGDFNYNSSNMGNRFGVPEIDAPNDNFKFEEADVDQKSWSVDFGMLYSFNLASKWQPFVGLGIGTSRLSKNEITEEKVLKAIATFERGIVANNSQFDQYMHNGIFDDLEDVLDFYEDISDGRGGNNLDEEVRDLRLNGGQIDEIVAFLNALNDNDFDKVIPTIVPSQLPVGGNIH